MIMKNTRLISRGRRLAGFSLVETVIALGIMGLAITALLGLIPHGVEMSRKAGQASAMARVVDTISSRLNNMPFSSLATGSKQKLFFDDQGVQLDTNAAGTSTAYVVEVEIRPTLVLPGSTTAQPGIHSAIIRMAATPDVNFTFSDRRQNTFQTLPLILGPVIP